MSVYVLLEGKDKAEQFHFEQSSIFPFISESIRLFVIVFPLAVVGPKRLWFLLVVGVSSTEYRSHSFGV